MKKNILGALVILFVTIAFLLVINDISTTNDLSDHVIVHKTTSPSGLVGLDED